MDETESKTKTELKTEMESKTKTELKTKSKTKLKTETKIKTEPETKSEITRESETEKKYPHGFYVYILLSSDCKASYVGATFDLEHRLRQHNKIIKGGAYATSVKVNQGHTWQRICFIQNFPDWSSALQFEWRLKQISRKFDINNPKIRRLKALKTLLNIPQSTSKAIPFSEWIHPPEIIWTEKDDENIYDGL